MFREAEIDANSPLEDALGVTVRSFPIEGAGDTGPCVCTGKPATNRLVFAMAH